MPEAAPGGDGGFTREVPAGGYAWWYLDAVSDDGSHGLTVIAFIGSVFSPYYAAARARAAHGAAAAVDHVACNIALYGPAARWAMTERGRGALVRSSDRLDIGPSSLVFDGARLVVTFDEVGVPWPRRLRGQVVVTPRIVSDAGYALDAVARHRWCPLWPAAAISVALDAPRLAWHGHAYVDHNHGSEPLEAAFADWQWSRSVGGADARVRYEVRRRDGSTHCLGLRFSAGGGVSELPSAAVQRLPASPLWRIPRSTRSGGTASVERTLEDTPFYARSLLTVQEHAQPAQRIVHESLSLTRFRMPVVRWMLPFRMPRRA